MGDVFLPKGRSKFRFRGPDGKDHATGLTDKTAARKLMKDVWQQWERQQMGLPTIELSKRTAPIATILDEYKADLERRSKRPHTIKEYFVKLRQAVRECNITTLASFSLDTYSRYIETKNAPSTKLAHKAAMHAFFEFVCRKHYLPDNPLRYFQAGSSVRRTIRRAYTADELARLCATANGLIYKTAALTGFRRSELGRLEKRDLDPYADTPVWIMRPEIQKIERQIAIPILPELLPAIRKLWDSLASPTDRLFPRMPRFEDVRADQAQAGITRVDGRGRVADFHALRVTFCTLMKKAGMRTDIIQRFSRHKTASMLDRIYTDYGLTDLAAELAPLPISTLPEPLPPALPLPQNLDNSQAIITLPA